MSSSPFHDGNMNTLDEPIKETIVWERGGEEGTGGGRERDRGSEVIVFVCEDARFTEYRTEVVLCSAAEGTSRVGCRSEAVYVHA